MDDRLVRLPDRLKILELLLLGSLGVVMPGRGRLGRVKVVALGKVLSVVDDEMSGIVGSEGRLKLGRRPCSAGVRATNGTVRSTSSPLPSLKPSKEAAEKRGAAANMTP